MSFEVSINQADINYCQLDKGRPPEPKLMFFFSFFTHALWKYKVAQSTLENGGIKKVLLQNLHIYCVFNCQGGGGSNPI